MITGVKAAKTMVDNLVTFAAFLGKRGELRPTQLDFGEVVHDAVAPLIPLAEGKDISLRIVVPDNLPPVYGDMERLADAMYHLVHNAVKFTDAGGQVWIRCWGTADAAHFQVKDTGAGVPVDKLSTLWEGFTQMADPLRRGVAGLGLGLALVRFIVGAHGGQVWSESKENAGSTFGFRVPWNGPKDQVTTEPTTTSEPKSQAAKRR
jgi:signal transduction histidine kinase